MSVDQFFPRMHDWILGQIIVDWDQGRVAIELKPTSPQPQVLLVGSGLKALSCPRRLDWGPSAFILETEFQDLGSHRKLALQMQSGDLIELEVDSIVIDGPVATHPERTANLFGTE